MKKAFELVIDPADLSGTVDSYDRLGKAYPSRFKLGNGQEVDTDLAASGVWAEALLAQGRHEPALALWKRMEKDRRLPPELADEVNLRMAEAYLALGKREEAERRFTVLAAKPENPRRIDAEVNLLICEIARGDTAAALARSETIRAYGEKEPLAFRAALPMGMADYAAGRFGDALARLSTVEDDSRARYFQAMSLRRLGRPQEEIAQWQALRGAKERGWAELAEMQLAESYFALGDDGLSRQVAEKALAKNPEGATAAQLQFRLASIDFRAGQYDAALARLQPLVESGVESQRSTILMAESLAKTGKSKELFEALARLPNQKKTAEGAYQTAWAALFERRFEEAIATSDRGLVNFFDPEFTPRLLLLQGLAFEHMGKPAEAMATYQTISDRFPESHAAAHSAHWITLAYLRLNRPLEAATHGAYLWSRLPDAVQRQVPDAAFWIAEAHLRLRRWDDADKLYARFLEVADPAHERAGTAMFQRSLTLARMNRGGEALAMLDTFSRHAAEHEKPELVQLAHLQKGNILFNDRQFAQAVAEYRSAGESSKAKFHEALALYRMDYITDAVEKWTKLAEAMPDDAYAPRASFRAARATFELGKSTEAVAAFAHFIEKYPSSPDVKAARLQSAHALFNAGDAAGALPLYASYVAAYRAPEDLAAVAPYLASCLVQTGKNAEEAEAVMAGLPPTEGLAQIQWLEGAKKYNEKAFDEASARFTTLASAMPAYENAGPALFYRAESLYQDQRWFEAEGAFNSYLGVQPEKERDPSQAATALFHRGVSAYNQDRLLDAAASFAAVATSYPENPLAKDAAKNLVLCYHYLGDWSTADKMRAAYNIAPDNAPAKPSETPEFETTVDDAQGEPRRGVTEIPKDLSFRRSTGSVTEMAGDPSHASLPAQ